MFKLIIKGILLYTTILVILFFIMGIESIFDHKIMLEWVTTILILVVLCYKYITKEELKTLSLVDNIDKLLN